VARVRRQRLVVADTPIHCRVTSLVTGRVHAHSFEKERTELEPAAQVDEPGIDVRIVTAARDDTGRRERRLPDGGTVTELVHDGRIEGPRPQAEPRVETHRVAVFVGITVHAAVGLGVGGGRVETTTTATGATGRR